MIIRGWGLFEGGLFEGGLFEGGLFEGAYSRGAYSRGAIRGFTVTQDAVNPSVDSVATAHSQLSKPMLLLS